MPAIRFAIVGFDLDGTLLDTAADLGAAVNHALALAGREAVAIEQTRGFIGRGARVMLDRALAATGGPIEPEPFEGLFAALLAQYEANIAVHTRLYPGGEAMLAALAAAGVKLAIATNKSERLTHLLLDALDLRGRFAAIVGGDTLGRERQKPAPDMLHEMAARCGGGVTAFVGDTTLDMRAARAAGMPGVAVSFGFNDVPAGELGADAVIDSFAELVPTLARLSYA